jgi:hypothetical protein
VKNSACPSLRLLEMLVKDANRRRDKSTNKDLRSEIWSTRDRVQLIEVLVDRHRKVCPVCSQKIASEGALANFERAV